MKTIEIVPWYSTFLGYLSLLQKVHTHQNNYYFYSKILFGEILFSAMKQER